MWNTSPTEVSIASCWNSRCHHSRDAMWWKWDGCVCAELVPVATSQRPSSNHHWLTATTQQLRSGCHFPSCHIPKATFKTSQSRCHIPKTVSKTSQSSCHIPKATFKTSQSNCHIPKAMFKQPQFKHHISATAFKLPHPNYPTTINGHVHPIPIQLPLPNYHTQTATSHSHVQTLSPPQVMLLALLPCRHRNPAGEEQGGATWLCKQDEGPCSSSSSPHLGSS